jgi:membrane-associated phospholipid phosphatase
VLSSGSELRPTAPPDQPATKAELQRLHTLESRRDAASLDQIAYWDTGDPAYRWEQLAVSKIGQTTPAGATVSPLGRAPDGQRAMALFSVAIYDATIAAWDAKYAYNRPHPSDIDATLQPAMANPSSPSYPSEHAVVAGAASSILAYLFPDESGTFSAQADQAEQSRLIAGVAFPSDIQAGHALGQAVAARVIEHAKADGADAVWDGKMPDAPKHWTPDPGTQPVGPLAGTWKPWVLDSGSQFRPGPPPAPDSDQEAAELDQVRNFPRTWGSNFAVYKWSPPSFTDWSEQLWQKLFEYRLDGNPPRAARAYALVAVAAYDSMVACWDAKYTYWAPRPYNLDPSLVTVLPHYAHPSYPSAHSCIASSSAEALAALFPRDAHVFRDQAQELADSRWQAGIHFPTDSAVGLSLGRSVGDLVVERSHSDGSE